MKPVLKRVIWSVNTLGFVAFLAWLASMSDRQILREQDGILYFLPCVPFLFVFVLLLEPKPRKPSRPSAELSPPPAEEEDNEVRAGGDHGGDADPHP